MLKADFDHVGEPLDESSRRNGRDRPATTESRPAGIIERDRDAKLVEVFDRLAPCALAAGVSSVGSLAAAGTSSHKPNFSSAFVLLMTPLRFTLEKGR